MRFITIRRILPSVVMLLAILLLPSSDAVTNGNSSLAGEWIEKSSTPKQGDYGEAIVGTGSYIYAIRGLSNGTGYPSYFWKYDPSGNNWVELKNRGDLPDSNLPKPKGGTSIAWDNNAYIYAMFGGAYGDTGRKYFFRYSVMDDVWQPLNSTPFPQGAGDAITWSGYDGYIYALMGNKHGAAFARYKYDSWEMLALNPSWTATEDGASLAWDGGEYLYALQGEYDETVPHSDFARYRIPTQTWENMKDIPASRGVGDGASLLWVGEYPDYIFALSGGAADEDPGYNFYRYSISTDSWEQLESIPYPVGNYVGNRLGFAEGHIYYWQGAPSTWQGGGDKFFMFEQQAITDRTPPAGITNLRNISYSQDYINWSWEDPLDSDFSRVMVYLDGIYHTSVPRGIRFYNATGIAQNTEHTIATRTVDTAGNINLTWANHTAMTAPTISTKGDVNNIPGTDVGDVLFAAQAVTGLRTFTPEQIAAVDVNSIQGIDVGDVLFIAQAVAGLRVL